VATAQMNTVIGIFAGRTVAGWDGQGRMGNCWRPSSKRRTKQPLKPLSVATVQWS